MSAPIKFNEAKVRGRLGGDPDLRETSGGKSVCTFSLAFTSEQKGQAHWFNVKAWDELAGRIKQTLSKGDLVDVSGQFRVESWQSNGEQKSKLVLVAEQVARINNVAKPEPKADEFLDDEEVPF